MEVETMGDENFEKEFNEVNKLYDNLSKRLEKREKELEKENTTSYREKPNKINEKPNKTNEKPNKINEITENDKLINSIQKEDEKKKLKYSIDEKIFDDFFKSNLIQKKEAEMEILKQTLKQKNDSINKQKEEIKNFQIEIDELIGIIGEIREMFTDRKEIRDLKIFEKINMNFLSFKQKETQKDKIINELQEHLLRQKYEIEAYKSKSNLSLKGNEDLSKFEASLKAKDGVIQALKQDLNILREENKKNSNIENRIQIQTKYDQLKAENLNIKTLYDNLKEENLNIQKQYDQLKEENLNIEDKIHIQKEENSNIKTQYDNLKEENTKQIKKNENLNTEINKTTKEMEKLTKNLNLQKTLNSSLKTKIENLEENKIILENQIKEVETINSQLLTENKENYERERVLKERILDLQGNIRVFLRIRKPTKENNSMEYKIKNNQLILKESSFNFDWIYPRNTHQRGVFSELDLLVKSVFDGYSIIISCYGQTGSGKTFTMEGKEKENNEQIGIFPRSIDTIFESIKELKENNFQTKIKFSAVEIYNDKTNFFTEENQKNENKKNNKKNKNLEILYEEIQKKEEIYEKYQKSISKRKTSATKCNEYSSRSHFLIFLKFEIQKGEEKRTGQICFIDLAGSERIGKSQVKGERLKETTSINTSLLGLRNVLYALKKRKYEDEFIPYRNCTLTHILKPFFENKIRMVMIVNISDLKSDFNETLCSLRFGEMSRDVKFGRAEANIELKK